jgi:ribosomal protein S18 acetylase RimI-like enzyme
MPPTRSPVTEFRRGTPDDALCLGVLAMQVFLDTYATEGIRPDLAREALSGYLPKAFARRLGDRDTTFVLAEHAAHLVGFAEVVLDRELPVASAGHGAELVRLYVQRPFKRRGVGTALLARAEALAAECSAACLWLTAWSGNAAALAFYVALGYEDIGVVSHVLQGKAYENRLLRKAAASSARALADDRDPG